MNHQTRTNIALILDCCKIENGIVPDYARTEIAAELLLDKDKSDRWDYLDDKDIPPHLAQHMLSDKEDVKQRLLDTMIECVVKNMNPQIDQAIECYLNELNYDPFNE